MADSVVEVVYQPPAVIEVVEPSQASAIEAGLVPIVIAPSEPDTVELTFTTGPPGPPDMLGIGTIITGAAGTAASATITGTFPNRKLNLTIPRGSDGQGVPTGGTTGQVLQKVDGIDFNTSWIGATNASTADTVMRRSSGNTVAVGQVDLTSVAPAQSSHATRKDYVDAQRDTRVAKSGDTMTGTLTFPELDDALGGAQTNKFYIPNASAISMAPFGSLWHDLLAFSRHVAAPTYETSPDGVTWTSATFPNGLVASKDATATTLINGTTASGSRVRFTWNSANLAFASNGTGTWLVIGWGYGGAGSVATRTVMVESSQDGVTWTTRHTSSYAFDGRPVWHFINDWGSANRLRITITHTAGGNNLVATALRMLTARWGDQGAGQELSYPYDWDGNRTMYFVRARSSNAPAQADELTRKDYVDGLGSEDSTASTIVRRNSNKTIAAGNLALDNAPTQTYHATRKDYVDGLRRTPTSFKASDYTLALTDEGTHVLTNHVSNTVTITVPNDTTANFPVGAWVDVTRWQTGGAVVAPGAGVTLGLPGVGGVDGILPEVYASVRITKVAANSWTVRGYNNDTVVQAVNGATSADTPDTLVRRFSNGSSDFKQVGITTAAPTLPNHAARKDYVDGLTAQATDTTRGTIELATNAEVQTGTDTTRAVTPAGLAARTATETRTGVVELATTAEATTGIDTARAVTPAGVKAVADTKAALAHTHAIADVNATGTRDGTTFLRGDGTWAVPPGGSPTYATLPAGTTITVQKSGGTWPARPTSRADITVAWKGADPSPAIVSSGTGGMLDNVDYRLVTP